VPRAAQSGVNPITSRSEIQKIIFARHGHRYPFVGESHPLGRFEGLLTGHGLDELVALGRRFKERFASFVPEPYDPDRIIFHSTDLPRTVQSAQMVAMGMYPGLNAHVYRFKPEGPTDLREALETESSMGAFYELVESKGVRWADGRERMRDEVCRLLGIEDPARGWGGALEYFHFLRHMKALPPDFPADLAERVRDFFNMESRLMIAYKNNIPRHAPYQLGIMRNMLLGRAKGADQVSFHYISSHDCHLGAVLLALDVPFESYPDFAEYVEITLCRDGDDFSVIVKPHDAGPERKMKLDAFQYSDKNRLDDEDVLARYGK